MNENAHIHGIPEERPDLCPECGEPLTPCCVSLRSRRRRKHTRPNLIAWAFQEAWAKTAPTGLPPTDPA